MGGVPPPEPPARLPPPPYVHAPLVHAGCSVEGTAPLLLRYRCGMTWITIIAMITSGSRSVHVGSSVGAGVRLGVIRELHTEARRRTPIIYLKSRRHKDTEWKLQSNFGSRDDAEALV